MESLKKVRNIGILHPIPHGKTTLTVKALEKLLADTENKGSADGQTAPQSSEPETGHPEGKIF